MTENNLNTEYESKSHVKTYLILEKSTNLIKIGRSKNINKRLASLQTSNPLKLNLLHVFDCDIEFVLHKRFCNNKVRGEWFDVSIADIMNFVKTLNIDNYVIKKQKPSANNSHPEFLDTMLDLFTLSRINNDLKTVDDNGYDLVWIDTEGRYSDNGQPYFEKEYQKNPLIKREYEMIYMIVFGKPESVIRLSLGVHDYDDFGPSIPKSVLDVIRTLQRANTVYIEDGLDFQERKEKLTSIFNRKHKQKLIEETHLLNA